MSWHTDQTVGKRQLDHKPCHDSILDKVHTGTQKVSVNHRQDVSLHASLFGTHLQNIWADIICVFLP